MSRHGVLLINLGSPDSTSVPDVRKYLGEFLMDPRVIDSPWPVRWSVVNLAILPSRPAQSAEAYGKVWTSEGSPLLITSRNVKQALQNQLGEKLVVELAMRYRNPSIELAMTRLKEEGITDLLVFPMFPHYAMSSFETAAVRATEVALKLAPNMRLKIAQPYYNAPAYIEALVASSFEYLQAPHDHLLFSFHGLPERHLRKADCSGRHCLVAPGCCETPNPAHETCYRAQCLATVRAFVATAGVPENKYSVAFQSRLWKDPWLKPYTDLELVRLASEGVKRLLVICPAFVSDCLETLEEIAIRGREIFIESGGLELQLIPCMNEHEVWLSALEKIVRNEFTAGRSTGTQVQPVARFAEGSRNSP